MVGRARLSEFVGSVGLGTIGAVWKKAMSTGTVKWFNEAKGFGFIAPEGGGDDVFVHISAVERSGLLSLNEGDTVSFEIEQDRRSGKNSATNLRVLSSGGPSPRSSGGGGGGGGGSRAYASGPSGGTGSGTVKWFNTTKGFGFIQPDNGGPDVFVHISAVERAGLRGLNEGQRISYELQTDRKTGKQAAGNLRAE